MLLLVSRMVDDLHEIAELELSLVIARPDGVQAVDGRIASRRPSRAPPTPAMTHQRVLTRALSPLNKTGLPTLLHSRCPCFRRWVSPGRLPPFQRVRAAVAAQVHMHVDQPRQDRRVRKVHHRRQGWPSRQNSSSWNSSGSRRHSTAP
jgi:hypothetical protein